MDQPVTPEQARALFDAMAALDGVKIAFRWLHEGCECRAQVMIEEMQAMGWTPGRVWALAVGRPLRFVDPERSDQTHHWLNHVAPTLPVAGVEGGVLVIDPSLTRQGPLTLTAWATAMRARSVEVFTSGQSQAAILTRQADLALQGRDLDAVLFLLKLGEPPVPEAQESGYVIAPDPTAGPSADAHERMKRYLSRQAGLAPPRR